MEIKKSGQHRPMQFVGKVKMSKKPEQACYWCPEMVEIKDSNAVIHSRFEENHTCNGDCPKAGRFTSGIETRRIIGDNNSNKGTDDELLFLRRSAILNAG